MKPNNKQRYAGLYVLSFFVLLLLFSCPLLALGKTGTNPGAPLGGGDFVAGNPAVADDINKQINILYKAFNDGTSSINIDSWTNAAGNLGYTGGSLGVGISAPIAKFNVAGGTAITLAGATGFGVFGVTTANHVAIDSTQIQAKASATTVAPFAINPLGGFVGIGTTPGVKFHVDGGTAVSTISGSGYAAFGPATGQHIAIDATQIQSKSSGTTAANMALNALGGFVGIGTSVPGAKLHVKGVADSDGTSLATIKATGGLILENAAGTSALNIDDNELNSSSLFYINTSSGRGLSVGGNMMVNHPTANNAAWLTVKGTGDGTNNSGISLEGSGTNLWHMAMRQNSPFQFILAYYDGAAWSNYLVANTSTGCLTGPAGTNIQCSSDLRLKDEIRNLDGGLAKILQLRGVDYYWKADRERARRTTGLIAQEVETVIPGLVVTRDDTMRTKGVDYQGLIPYLVEAVKDLKLEKDKQILALQREKSVAESRIAALEKNLVEQGRRLNDELLARKQQEIRLAKLEQLLQRQAYARR